MSAKFTYQRLNERRKEVRYLQILPGSEAVIQCRLEHAALDTPHICLSHRWTGKAGVREIFVNDKLFTVSANIWHFLEVARRKYSPKTLFWIDQICINQESIAEKNTQVPLMGEIYKKADIVVTWLGICDREIVRCAKAMRSGRMSLNQNIYDHAVLSRNDFWANFWDHIVRFFENDYWRRAWVVQEVLLGNHQSYLLVNDVELEWSSLAGYWQSVMASSIAPQTHYQRLNSWVFKHSVDTKLGKSQRRDEPLRTLISLYGEQACNDFHDRVYALLALAEDRMRISVDYGSSREDLFFHTLHACGSDKCFCFAAHLCKILRLAPTRPPQYSGWNEFRPGAWIHPVYKFKADQDLDPFVSIGISPNDIIPTGVPFHHLPRDDEVWMRSLPHSWRIARDCKVVRFLCTPVPAEFLLKKFSGAGSWYCSALRFHHGNEWTRHTESFLPLEISGISVHTVPDTDELCCLRFTRSALLKLLIFGEQHSICNRDSHRGYNFVDHETKVLKCGLPVDDRSESKEERRDSYFRHRSASMTPRPSTPSTPIMTPPPSSTSASDSTTSISTSSTGTSTPRTPDLGVENTNPWQTVLPRRQTNKWLSPYSRGLFPNAAAGPRSPPAAPSSTGSPRHHLAQTASYP